MSAGKATVPWSPAEDAEVRALRDQSKSYSVIAREMSVMFKREFTRDHVRKRLDRLKARAAEPILEATAPKMASTLEARVDAAMRQDEANDLFEMSRGRLLDFEEACDRLDVAPRRLRDLADELIARGQEVRFAPRNDQRLEHRLRGEIRDLNAARQHLLNELKDQEAKIGVLTALREQPPVKIEARKATGPGKRRQGTPVMLLSDWHVEEPVFPENVNGLNEYNPTIAERCIDRCAEAWEWFAQDKRWDMREGVIWLGGDLFSGYIHDELVEGNFMSPVEAVVWLQERLERMFRRILRDTNFERIIVPCNDGNHGRLTHKIRVSTRTSNSLEWLMYKSLASKLADEPRLQFQIAEGHYSYLDIYDRTIAFTHGDTFRYQGGVGGLLIPVRRGLNEIRKYRSNVACFCLGHFHQRLDAGDIVVNGSMIGMNAYSMAIQATPEPRQQSWFLVDAQRGKCVSAPIWLT